MIFQVRTPLYNYLFLIFLFQVFMTTIMEPQFNLVCQPVDYSEKPQSKRVSSTLCHKIVMNLKE